MLSENEMTDQKVSSEPKLYATKFTQEGRENLWVTNTLK